MISSPSHGPSPQADARGEADQPPLIAVVGLTASGKSEWAMRIARQLGGEIVSVDSRQMYRRLNIGTAKPSAVMQAEIPHWCLNIVDPVERYSLGEYLAAARAALADIQSRGKRPILVGGSGQHMRALLEGWIVPPVEADSDYRQSLAAQPSARLFDELQRVDPAAAARIGDSNVRRLIRALEVYRATATPISEWQRRREPVCSRAVAPDLPLSEIDERIAQRAQAMFEAGFVEEVCDLLADGLTAAAPGFDSIGYREVLAHLRGDLPLSEARAAVIQATRRFARRQRAWFRRDDPSICWAADVPLHLLE